MSNYDSLVLLTKVYPFATGEEFLEEEIKILSEYFKNIYVIASAVPYGSKQIRKVPANITVYAIYETANRYLKYTKYFLKGVTSIFKKDSYSEFRGKNIVGKLGVIYVAGRSRCLANKIASISAIMEQLKNHNILLYSYWFSDLPYVSILLKKKANNDSLKIVSRAHGYDLYEYRNITGHIPFRKIVISKIDKVFPCSMDGQMYLQNMFPMYAEKVQVSYLGTKDCGMGINIIHDVYHIVTCSSIIPLKRLNLVAKALKILEGKGFSCKWTCIGDGPQLDQLKAYVKSNLKTSTVVFTGRVKHDQVLELLKNDSFDLFVNVSESEGLPVAIMEAASFGIPILATNVGGTKEIVTPCVTGLLLPKDIMPIELASSIVECMKCSFNRVEIRNYWNDHFNSDRNYRLFSKQLLNI